MSVQHVLVTTLGKLNRYRLKPLTDKKQSMQIPSHQWDTVSCKTAIQLVTSQFS